MFSRTGDKIALLVVAAENTDFGRGGLAVISIGMLLSSDLKVFVLLWYTDCTFAYLVNMSNSRRMASISFLCAKVSY